MNFKSFRNVYTVTFPFICLGFSIYFSLTGNLFLMLMSWGFMMFSLILLSMKEGIKEVEQ